MKVIVDARYVRPKPSGIGSYVRAIATRLPALAPTDHFSYWAHPEFVESFGRHANLGVKPVSGDPQGPVTMFAPSRLSPISDANIFHSPHNILGRGIRMNTVVTVHDLMWLEAPELLESNRALSLLGGPYFGAGAMHALEHATRIIAVSHATADAIARVYPAASVRTRVIQNAADPFFAPAENVAVAEKRAAEILGTNAPYFLVIGTSQPYKDHAAALRAFAAAKLPKHKLVLIQRRNAGGPLVSLADALGISGQVIWRSALASVDILTLYHAATALIHPSRMEGFGLPVLEAMSAGCAVVATDIAPLREVAGDAGVMAPLFDTEGLARGITQLANAPNFRAEKREAGLLRAQAFSWDKAARETLEVYREAASVGV